MAEGSHPEFEQTWLGLERVRPGTRAVSHAKRLDDGRLVVDVSVAEPWTWAPLLLMCRSCEDMSKTEHRIYRNNPTAVDTTVTRPCPCGDVQVVAEVYTLYDESNGKPFPVRNARRSAVVPTAATGEKFSLLAKVTKEVRDALDTETPERLLELQVELRGGNGALPRRLALIPGVEDFARANPYLAAALLAAITTLLGFMLSQVASEPAPAITQTVNVTVVRPSDEVVNRIVRQVLDEQDRQQAGTTPPPAATPSRRERREQERRGRRER